MYRSAFLAWLVIVSGIVHIAAPSSAAEKKKTAVKPDSAPGGVEKVLRAEVTGVVDRRDQLAETLKQQPDSPAARWQAGFVKDGDSWRSFDQVWRNSATAGVLEDYRRRREETQTTFAGQMALAH